MPLFSAGDICTLQNTLSVSPMQSLHRDISVVILADNANAIVVSFYDLMNSFARLDLQRGIPSSPQRTSLSANSKAHSDMDRISTSLKRWIMREFISLVGKLPLPSTPLNKLKLCLLRNNHFCPLFWLSFHLRQMLIIYSLQYESSEDYHIWKLFLFVQYPTQDLCRLWIRMEFSWKDWVPEKPKTLFDLGNSCSHLLGWKSQFELIYTFFDKCFYSVDPPIHSNTGNEDPSLSPQDSNKKDPWRRWI